MIVCKVLLIVKIFFFQQNPQKGQADFHTAGRKVMLILSWCLKTFQEHVE